VVTDIPGLWAGWLCDDEAVSVIHVVEVDLE
jgi:hypothetical protein